MNIQILSDNTKLGAVAADQAATFIKKCIQERSWTNIILATGASQFQTLKHLTTRQDVDWSKVAMFHLDEYIGIEPTHPASFQKYLMERFVSKIDPAEAYFIKGDTDAEEECRRIGALIKSRPIDVALIGIGENAHLAFNDPPADFSIKEPFIVVDLDEACRRQQVGEGWFPSIDEVPSQAISMSITQIMKSTHLIVSVPDQRKAKAVKCTVEGPLDPHCPASILQNHSSCFLFLDKDSSSLLNHVTN